MTVPGGDTCSNVPTLSFTQNASQVQLDFTGFADDSSAGCGTSGVDGVVAFDVTSADTFVTVDVSGPSGSQVGVSLRSMCSTTASETACGATGSLARRLPIGRHFIWVEATGSSGPFTLTVRRAPIVAGDACTLPRSLTLSGGAASVSASLFDFGPDALACTATGRDSVYTFSLTSPSSVTVRAVPAAGFDPTLTLGSTCTAATQCTGAGPGATETIQQTLAAGTYFVGVGSADGSAGSYTLSVSATALMTPDAGTQGTCVMPYGLTFDAQGNTSTFVRTAGRANTLVTSCLTAGSSGPDSVYQFTVTSPSDLRATLSGAVRALALRSACTGMDIACGGAINVADLQPGDYFLVADAYLSETSSLTLNAQLTAPRPTGETCARPQPLSLGADGGTVMISESLASVTDDIPNPGFGDCTGITNAPDRIFSITIGRPLIISATATRTSTASGAVEVAFVSSAGCPAGFATTCMASTTTASVRELLPAGTHLIRVQGSVGASFSLVVTGVEPPEGESCANAIAISLPPGGGNATHTATTRGSTQENFNNACVGYDMPDRVYAVTVADPSNNLVVTTTAIGSTNAPAFIVVDQCNQIVPFKERCGTTAAATKTLNVTGIAAGTYFIWVKGPVIAGTDYRIDFSSTTAPPGETCRMPIAITTSAGLDGGSATVTGTTLGALNDYNACRQISPAFSDVVYSVTIGRPLDLRMTMTPAAGAAGTLTSLDPGTCFDRDCVSGTAGAPVTLKLSLDAGTALIAVDHTSGGPGPFTLDVQLAPPRIGEQCDLPQALTIPLTGGTQQLTVDLRDYVGAQSNGCGQGGDAYFSFTITQPLDLRVTPVTTTGAPRVGLGTSCADIACQFGGSVAAGSLQPGTHLLVIDTDFPRNEQIYTFDISLTPPTPGDTCSNPIALSIPGNGGSQTVTGSLAGAFSEFSFPCSTSYADRVYSFTTTRPMGVIAEATPPLPDGGAPVLSLRSTTCVPNSPALACGPSAAPSSHLRVASLPAGTHYLTVDRAGFSSPEAYSLSVSLGDRPMGDTCSSAIPLGLPTGPGQVTVRADTRRFFHDLTPSCGASGGTRDAPDVAYSFTLVSPMNVRLFTRAVTPGFRPTVALKRGCATGDTDQVCGWTPTFSSDTWASWENLAAGTWYVIVDGYDALQAGEVDLTVRTSPANPTGDSCTAPQPVSLSNGNTGRATLTGSYADYFEDFSDCWSSTGADVVYAVTTNQPRRLHARATPSVSTAQPTLSLRTTCATSTSQVACARSSFDGTGRLATNVPAGTSFLIMKSGLAFPQGTYSLEVAVDDFPAGDVCSAALPLNFAGTTASVSGDSYTFGADATMSCDTSTAPDTFFTFTTSAPGNFTATLQRQNTSDSFAMALYPGCAGAERVCRSSGFSSAPLVLSQTALPAGTWVLAVRGGTTAPSGFTINATLTP